MQHALPVPRDVGREVIWIDSVDAASARSRQDDSWKSAALDLAADKLIGHLERIGAALRREIPRFAHTTNPRNNFIHASNNCQRKARRLRCSSRNIVRSLVISLLTACKCARYAPT